MEKQNAPSTAKFVNESEDVGGGFLGSETLSKIVFWVLLKEIIIDCYVHFYNTFIPTWLKFYQQCLLSYRNDCTVGK